MKVSNISRQMSSLERFADILHSAAEGATAVGTLVKVNRLVSLPLFLSAWQVLFARHPMLRATVREEQGRGFFDFNACFGEVPIWEVTTERFEDIEKIYGDESVQSFAGQRYLWRSILIHVPNAPYTYMVFGASHSICDGKSIARLFNELLDVMDALEQGRIPPEISQATPDPIDAILDRARFVSIQTQSTGPTTVAFDAPSTVSQAQTHNILKTLDAQTFARLTKACTAEKTTVTAVLCAALALAARTVRHPHAEQLLLSTAVDLRPYTTTQVTPSVLAFYAHQVFFEVDVAQSDLWAVARQSKALYSESIKTYALPDAGNPALVVELKQMLADSIRNNQFLITYCVTNAGQLDGTFANHPEVESFHFTVNNRAMFVMVVSAATVKGQLCLNFNYTTPALHRETAQALVDNMMAWLEAY